MGFWITILLSASIASIASLGLFLQMRSGQMNVGMAAFVGVGGYVSGVLGVHFEFPPAASISVAICAGFLFGVLFSALTLRLHHWFFAVITLSFSIAAVAAASMIPILGGGVGLMGIPIVTSPIPIVGGLLASLAIVYYVDHSPIGVSIRAVGDDQILALMFGVGVKRLRILVFGTGSALAALAGALQAHRFGLYEPSDLGFQPSMLLFVYVLVGGKMNVFGPLIGSFFLYTLPELVRIGPQTELIVYGALMVLVGAAMPNGVVGLLEAVGSRIVQALGFRERYGRSDEAVATPELAARSRGPHTPT